MGSNTKNCLSCGMPNWKEAHKCWHCKQEFSETEKLPVTKELLVKKGVIKEA